MMFWDLKTSSQDAIALKTQDEVLTYGELADLSRFVEQVLNKEEVILFLAPNTVGSIAVYLGALASGAIPLLMSDSSAQDVVSAINLSYEPELAWLPCNHFLSVNKQVLWSHDGYNLVRLRERQGGINPDLALLLPTSGSTGSSRYVRVTATNLQANAESIAEYLGLRSSDTAITSLPLSYSYGVSVVNSFLQAGASIAVTKDSLMNRSFWDFVRDSETTMISGVPYTYKMLERLHLERMDLPSLRMLTQAGGRLGEDLHQKFAKIAKEKDMQFFAMYGQTEATARISYLPFDYALDKIGSVGIAIPGGKIRLETKAYADVPVGVEGELVYEGPNVTLGYAENREDLSQGDEFGGVLHTGDIAVKDSDGFLFIRGRKSRFLKIFGNRVNLDDLERLLISKGFSIACTGEDDCLDVYVEGDDTNEVKQALKDIVSFPLAAVHIFSLEKLPRSDAGKILYAKLENNNE